MGLDPGPQGLRDRRRRARRRLAAQPALRLALRQLGSLPIEGGLEAAYRRELEAAADPEALRAEIEARLTAVLSPFRTAERFSVEEIIDPRDTRRLLCDWAEHATSWSARTSTKGPARRGPRP
jgi:acetyl-CoA carboxylase carboxyltransferase component